MSDHRTTYVFDCIAPDGTVAEVSGALNRPAAEAAAATFFGCPVEDIISRYRKTVLGPPPHAKGTQPTRSTGRRPKSARKAVPA